MIKILAFEGRWVFVGEAEKIDGDWIIKNGANIRYWGTTKGLGQLKDGPLSGTRLDPIPTLEFPESKNCGVYEVNQEKWNEALKNLHSKN